MAGPSAVKRQRSGAASPPWPDNSLFADGPRSARQDSPNTRRRATPGTAHLSRGLILHDAGWPFAQQAMHRLTRLGRDVETKPRKQELRPQNQWQRREHDRTSGCRDALHARTPPVVDAEHDTENEQNDTRHQFD